MEDQGLGFAIVGSILTSIEEDSCFDTMIDSKECTREKIDEKILEDCERSVYFTEERVFDSPLYISTT